MIAHWILQADVTSICLFIAKYHIFTYYTGSFLYCNRFYAWTGIL